MLTEHEAKQVREKSGRPVLMKAAVQIGRTEKGKEIWKTMLCELWELDGYETVVPQGYVPYYDERKSRWYRTPIGSKDDPNGQLGFIKDNSIPF